MNVDVAAKSMIATIRTARLSWKEDEVSRTDCIPAWTVDLPDFGGDGGEGSWKDV